jgi:hypothetical protein
VIKVGVMRPASKQFDPYPTGYRFSLAHFGEKYFAIEGEGNSGIARRVAAQTRAGSSLGTGDCLAGHARLQ